MDRFGNPIDPAAGFARGAFLASPTEDAMRMRHGLDVIRQRALDHGAGSIGIFTGNRRDLLLREGDLALAEEWIGPALYTPALDAAIRAHLDAPPDAASFVFNRGSAALVASMLALAPQGRVISVVPEGSRSHPSLRRGAMLAGAAFEEIGGVAELLATLAGKPASLLVVTTVTSSLARLADADIANAIVLGHGAGIPVLLDDAYGARIRTVLHGGASGFALGADLVVTNADKAGLPGPRAGIMAGNARMMAGITATASLIGMEARAPISLGVLRGLEAWSPAELLHEAAQGLALADALTGRLGAVVQRTDLGPLISPEDVLTIACARAGIDTPPIVPVEATALLGMLLMERHGMLTTNIAGQPGSHPALRLKPAGPALERCGGVEAVAAAVDRELDAVAGLLGAPAEICGMLLGRER
ncbi:MAG: Selenocysteine synthase [Rubritepida sp.]|nr:Selenocysteine synthase [Rubritepida sp.]